MKEFSNNINEQLVGLLVPEYHIKQINKRLNELTKEVEGIIPGQEDEIDYEKQKNIEAKTGGIIQKVLEILPQAAETAITFSTLTRLSKLIGKGVEQMVGGVTKRKVKQ